MEQSIKICSEIDWQTRQSKSPPGESGYDPSKKNKIIIILHYKKKKNIIEKKTQHKLQEGDGTALWG
jgi:hypothetical protein